MNGKNGIVQSKYDRQNLTIQYIPRNMHTVFALLYFVVVIHWLIFPYPSGLLHWHCGNLTIAPVPAKQPWCIWINTSCEFIMNDCISTTKQSTTKLCAYFLGYTVISNISEIELTKKTQHHSTSQICYGVLYAFGIFKNAALLTMTHDSIWIWHWVIVRYATCGLCA